MGGRGSVSFSFQVHHQPSWDHVTQPMPLPQPAAPKTSVYIHAFDSVPSVNLSLQSLPIIVTILGKFIVNEITQLDLQEDFSYSLSAAL